MKTIARWITVNLAAGIALAVFSPTAIGCGNPANLQAPFQFAVAGGNLPLIRPFTAMTRGSGGGPATPSIVGMWSVQYVAQGNSSRTPSIPDGAVVDFGYNQWHSDGTEILNSAGHAPASENFCLGVWGQTGYLTYELNHFALSYTPSTGTLANYVNIREQITLSPSGDKYSGPFTIDIYDLKGNRVDHIAGNITAQRVTVDSSPF
ncbi:MAG TPA: hypothetical protein VN736_05635 [Candidatus Limnocylindrales bacterium]|nr:hypothetical protein [Candidatus Limnocylindrales bacterium]